MSDAVAVRRRLPLQRASLRPLGLGLTKPHHFLEMARIAWENRSHLGYAYRVLTRGVCDGCALGTSGLRDWTLSGTHLCLVRLNLLRLNTLDALDPRDLMDVTPLSHRSAAELRDMGRIPVPLRRRRGEPGFTVLSWEETLAELGNHLRSVEPDQLACFMTSRGLTNEAYYATQKAMRALGSPHIDNAARLCHSPSTAAMKRVLGVAASTCSYRDWYGSDAVVFFGSNPANDQPVALKYLLEAKALGTRIYCVNTYREPGMERYWVPSHLGSALFGTHITDRFFEVSTGGDLAFIYAVQKLLIERGQVDEGFISAHTTGFSAYRQHLERFPLDTLVERSGASLADVTAMADRLAEARTGVFVWSMGLTQHSHGTQTVEALCCLALSLGFIGRPHCGLMPIRGHSGVQGGAEMGAYANAFPGGLAINPEHAEQLQQKWGFYPPDRVGWTTMEMIEAAADGRLQALYAVGGNFLQTLPDPDWVAKALARLPLRIHQDLVLTHPMLIEPEDTVFILPARTRYEHRGGVTETTTERRVIFSPHIGGHGVAEAREEWRIPLDLALAARPELSAVLDLPDADAIRKDIAKTIPSYGPITELRAQGDQFQWGGPLLCEDGRFPLPEGKARFVTSDPPHTALSPDQFHLATRRGKQFNSMIQGEVDPLTGAHRDHVLMHGKDMAALGLSEGDPVRIESEHGQYVGRVYRSPITRRNVQMHWPEANVLLPADRRDAGGGIPDYNVTVRANPLPRPTSHRDDTP